MLMHMKTIIPMESRNITSTRGTVVATICLDQGSQNMILVCAQGLSAR